MEIWIFGGGVFCNFGFGLRKKVGNSDFQDGGNLVFCNFRFGLREKESWKLGGGYSVKVMEKEKKPTLQKNLPDQFGIIPKSPIPSGLPNQC